MYKLFFIIFSIFLSIKSYAFEINNDKIFDNYGNNIKIKEYKRMVVIDPAAVETIFLLGGGDNIVGIGKNNKVIIAPKEKTEKIPSVGSASKPSFEKVVILEPDLVVLNRAAISMTANLKELKIPYIYHDSSKDLNEILKSIKIYGKLIGKEKEAEKLYNKNLKKLLKIKNERKNSKLKGAIVYTSTPLISFSNTYLPGKILNYLGVENIAKDAIGNMPILSTEHILKSDLDIILLSKAIGSVSNFLKANPILKNMNVAKNKNIFIIDATAFLRGSPLIFDEMVKLAKILNKIQ